MRTSDLPVDTMYIQWLSGLSLRKIGRAYNIGRMRVYGEFTRRYGKDCCNLRKQSLARAVYADYADLELAMKARGSVGLFRSRKTEDNYSKLQTTNISDYHLATPEIAADTYLKLSYYMYVSRMTTKLLYLTMLSRMNQMKS